MISVTALIESFSSGVPIVTIPSHDDSSSREGTTQTKAQTVIDVDGGDL
jgi:hypothetical protein